MTYSTATHDTRAREPLARIAAIASRARVDVLFSLLDALLVAAAYLAVLVLRFDGVVPNEYWRSFAGFVVFVTVVQLGCNWGWGLYKQVWRHASVHEARRVLLAGLTAAALIAPVYVVTARPVPLSVALLGLAGATALVGLLRFQSRLFAFQRRTDDPHSGLRVVVIGAGGSGAAVVRDMQRNPGAGFRPVAFLDDDPRKQGRSMIGVQVVAGIDQLKKVTQELDVHRAILAIPNGGHRVVRRASAAADEAGVPLQLLPGLGEQMRGRVSIREVRDLRIDDLLGRQEVETDLEAVRRLIAGRRVLVTGGGGSIGSEIARQVAGCEPQKLVLVDNDETHLHDTAASVEGEVVSVLADVRDDRRLTKVFELHRPEIVFHAAAHKHVPMLEANPGEAVATNVRGTANVVQCATATGAEHFVFISSDKAVQPESVMGASKWFGEQIVLTQAPSDARFSAVRFGNVLGSRGSVIPTFARQIDAGGPVTVTDPRMTRYFMSIEEAVQLVLQTAVFTQGGEIFMLEMGSAVNILELAERMIRLAGYKPGTEIPIEIVGERPGERYAEKLCAPMEQTHPTPHESILRLDPIRLPPGLIVEKMNYIINVAARNDDVATAEAIVELTQNPEVVSRSYFEPSSLPPARVRQPALSVQAG